MTIVAKELSIEYDLEPEKLIYLEFDEEMKSGDEVEFLGWEYTVTRVEKLDNGLFRAYLSLGWDC